MNGTTTLAIITSATTSLVVSLIGYFATIRATRLQTAEQHQARIFAARLEAYTDYFNRLQPFLKKPADFDLFTDLVMAIHRSRLIASPECEKMFDDVCAMFTAYHEHSFIDEPDSKMLHALFLLMQNDLSDPKTIPNLSKGWIAKLLCRIQSATAKMFRRNT